MSRFRNVAPLLAAGAAVVALAGCAPAAKDAASSPASSSTPAPPTDAAGLSALLKQSASKIQSAHLAMNITAGTTSLTGSGDETMAAGKLASLDLTEQIPQAGALRIIVVDGKTYLQLPPAMNKSGKPWVLVSPTSSNPAVRQLATTLESVKQTASLGQFTTFSSVATVTGHKQETLDGSPTTHYTLTVDVQKLPATLPGRQQLVAAGLTTLPIEMWVDDQGRPVKFSEDLTVKAQHVSTVVTLGKFDAPVTVTPPPADQVATD
ncbi:MAG: hypothetical protein ACXVF0_06560 [Blastococcus sp.]